ncbi:MAG: MBL fold metallo-hydrolase [Thermoleophilia bacterium]
MRETTSEATRLELRGLEHHAARDGGRITFLGHATVLIELDGLRILTDPVLRQQVGPLYRRTPRPLLGRLGDLDLILISHLHLDHYDPASLRLVAGGTPIVGPPGSARSLRFRGFTDVREIVPGEHFRLGGLEVVATEARHRGTRHPLARRTPSIGYVLSGSRDVYFAGDTGLFEGMSDLWDGLDVALLPIAGLGPWLPEFKHLSPRHAVRALELLRPRIVIPIHWGTYHLPGTVLMRMRPDIHRRAPFVFLREAEALEPDVRAVLLDPGDHLDLGPALNWAPPRDKGPAGRLVQRADGSGPVAKPQG